MRGRGVDSFSAARNEALSHATGDFAFWLDADDVVEPAEQEKLRELLGRLLSETPTKRYATITAIVGNKVAASANWPKNPKSLAMRCAGSHPSFAWTA